jgi:hypothetical protein
MPAMAPALVSCSGAPYALTFLLPGHLAAFVRPGTHQPCLAGCLLTIDRSGLVTVTGKTRPMVFDQVARFFRLVAKDRPPFMVSAALKTPDGPREAWEIAVNSQVTFTRDFAPVIASEIETIGNPRDEKG